MPYLDRLRPARYRSPSGAEFTFEFRDLSRAGGKKAAIHELPQQDLPEVQDLGEGALHFAIEALFHGPDYDQAADAFWDALAEYGPATLLHPRWGDLIVLPTTREHREGFVDNMRQATIAVDFVRVGTAPIPATAAQAESVIAADIEDADAAITEGMPIDPEDAADAANVEADARSGVAEFYAKIQGAVADAGDVSEDFDAKVRAFETAAFSPTTLAEDMLSILRSPSKAVTSILAKVRAYGGVMASIGGQSLEAGASPAEAATRILQFFGLLLGFSDAVLAGTMATRAEAVEAAVLAQDSIYAALEAIEQAESVSGYLSPEAILAAIKAILAQTSALLLERSFSLAIEQRMVLDADRTPLDLVYELADPESIEDLETALDAFIAHNRLTGDELLLIPRGREVVFYAG